ncbi:alanine--glyoxylate aminotransferase family protein [Fodinicurvata sp. EGI_FJ10296]|uniref:pyridoxal-phosphate-dependent aminotransferase family protein n=1 Tax=Fodinicurvata sp. EGI_FJ10296 TaxID=3231908 RepID=UPI003455BCBD
MTTDANRSGEIDPPARLMMGPGPINAYPRVLRAMSAQLLGQFDREFTDLMNETMALYRGVFRTSNRQTFLIDGTARAGIEAALVSLIEPGDRVLVPIFGRFGHLLVEIAGRCDAEVHTLETDWGTIFDQDRLAAAVDRVQPKLLAVCHGDTSTTMAQPLDRIGRHCRDCGVLVYVDSTATLGGMALPADDWALDVVSAGLQKCLGGPSGSAPITVSDRAAAVIRGRRHVEQGLAGPGAGPGPRPETGLRIRSNYFDLAMLMDYWGGERLNHHTESGTMLYGARECARLVLEEGLEARCRRHEIAGRALRAGLGAMGLALYGDPDHRMANVTGIWIPDGVDGEAVRGRMIRDFSIEIGTSFGPLKGRIWRIGTMGYNAARPPVLTTLAALGACLAAEGARIDPVAAIPAAAAVFERLPGEAPP